jgi:hypothetical protein
LGSPHLCKKVVGSSLFINELTQEQLNNELAKGYKDIEEGRIHSDEEVDEILKKTLDYKK